MTTCKKLIEVSMPVKEISAENKRDGKIQKGHISSFHKWWARRPLPVCRAVVFASLVYDPLDKNCPKQFKDALKKLLSASQYKPYEDIPWTAAFDPIEDNLRNRLIAFVGKFSDKYIKCEKEGKTCPPKEMLSDFSLIKWEARKNDEVLNIARKLIWVAHDPEDNTLEEFDKCFEKIKKAENGLYSLKDRHIDTPDVKEKQEKLDTAIKAFLDRMPRVFDPFAGGGAIPLEAAKLGCNSHANDLNPVAHIIEKTSLEFPQKFGKPIVYSVEVFENIYGEDALELQRKEGNIQGDEVHILNRLTWDIEYYCKKMLAMSEKEIGHLYPADEKGNKPVAYYWARVGTCANPSCRSEVPLLGQLFICDKDEKHIWLKPIINKNAINFEIKKTKIAEDGWMNRGNMTCPCCGNVTDAETLKRQFIDGKTKERLLAVIEEGHGGKTYREPTQKEINVLKKVHDSSLRPSEPMPVTYTQALPSCTWGLEKWGQMFTNRQLLALNTFVENVKKLGNELPFNKEYCTAIVCYLAILIDRAAARLTSFGLIDVGRETIVDLFGRQAIPMVFDFPESNPFCDSSGSAFSQIEWMTAVIENESQNPFASECLNANSGDVKQFEFGTDNATKKWTQS
jgi:adenine-specific DNA methylase